MNEGQRLFECFVGNGKAPDGLLQKYAAACASLSIGRDELVERLVAADADLAAVEMVRRRRDPRNGLTVRALLLLSLAEARPDCAEAFLLQSPSALRGWSVLMAAPLLAAYRWVKGTLLLWWHAR